MTEGGSGVLRSHRHGADLLHQGNCIKHGDVFSDFAVADPVISDGLDFDRLVAWGNAVERTGPTCHRHG